MKLSDQIKELRLNINNLQTIHLQRLNEIEKELEELTKVANFVEENWVGNWFQHTNAYKNFIQNKTEIINLQYEDIYNYVTSTSGYDYKLINEEIKNILKQFKSNNENLVTELSIIKSKDQFSEQVKILAKLEDYEWEIPAFKIIDSQKPKKFLGDYNTAQKLMSSGLSTPPHIAINANLLSNVSEVFSMKENLKIILRLLREIELQLSIENDEYINIDDPINNLHKIFNKFHDIARLLINRHANRETIKINDEYDVQDLLRGLLKIFFDDLRPEEFTPSHAGRNTRIDFLLKKEKIVIEVKKTRENLKDKEVGDELLQDIARYRNHPDCDILYCFVYDPQGLISNPRGLEADLSSESNDKMKVYVSIRP